MLVRTVHILTTNELAKLTMLWTTGPRCLLMRNLTLIYWCNTKLYNNTSNIKTVSKVGGGIVGDNSARNTTKINLRCACPAKTHWDDYTHLQILIILQLIFSRKILNIRKTCLHNFDPLKPHFYIIKLGYTGVYIIILISAQNIDCVYS